MPKKSGSGYPFSAKTQQEIEKTKEAIKSVRGLQGPEVAKNLFCAIKDSDRGKAVRQENEELGEQMQKDRESVEFFSNQEKQLDEKEANLLKELKSVQQSRQGIKDLAPKIAELKAKLGLTESVEELQEVLKQYILQRTTAIAHEVRKHNQWTDREVGIVKDVFPKNDNTKAVERKDVNFVGQPVEKEMKHAKISGDTLLVQPMTLDEVEWTGLKVPAGILSMKVADLSRELMDKEDNSRFAKIDMNVSVKEGLGTDWLVLDKHNTRGADGKAIVNIPTYDKSADTDVVRECLLKGTKPMGIVQTLVLREIIKQGLGDEYVNFLGYKADSDKNGYKDIRKLIEEIDEYTGLSFGDYTELGDTEYIVSNRGLYRDKNNNLNAFLRDSGAGDGCMGGVASLNLRCLVGASSDRLGFRSCL